MKLFVKQKPFSFKSKFAVKDECGEDRYYVEGEFFSMKGKLHIFNMRGEEVALIYRELFTFLPRYILEINGSVAAVIVKEFTFFKPSYRLDQTSMRVEGSFWSHEYTLLDGDREIMNISKEWFTWGDSYALNIHEPDHELKALGIVLAIDCALASQQT